LKNVRGVYSCSCPAWRNQSLPIERRTCKHLKALRSEAAEAARLGQPVTTSAPSPPQAEAPPLLLAEKWEPEVDPANWWMSEKLDGVRAWWDGQRRQFLSRQGNVYHAPAWFTERLPAMVLDGELWLGRGEFQTTVSIVRRQDQPADWAQLRFVIFDAPAVPEPFEQVPRAEYHEVIQALLAQGLDEPLHERAYVRRRVGGLDHLGASGLQGRVERRRKLRVPVVHQFTGAQLFPLRVVHERGRLLFDPGLVRMLGRRRQVYPPRLNMQKDQHEQLSHALQRQRPFPRNWRNRQSASHHLRQMNELW